MDKKTRRDFEITDITIREVDGVYLMDVSGEERANGEPVEAFTFFGISLPFSKDRRPLIHHEVGSGYKSLLTIDFGFGVLPFSHVKREVLMKEMTVEEVEKALGYKVKIVGSNL